MLFQRDTRSKTKTIKAPAYLEHAWIGAVQLTQKTAKKKRKLSSDLRPCWKLCEAVGSADEDSDLISDETGDFSLLWRIKPLTPDRWVSPSRFRSTCLIWKKLKCIKNDWIVVFPCPCGLKFFNRHWRFEVFFFLFNRDRLFKVPPNDQIHTSYLQLNQQFKIAKQVL
jgi:hypothetical protein